EDAHRLAHMGMFLAHRAEPVLPAHRIDVARLHPFGREPVRPLPPELRSEDSAVALETLVKRRDDARPPAFVFLVREPYRVVLAVSLERAVADPGAVAVHAREAADVHRP